MVTSMMRAFRIALLCMLVLLVLGFTDNSTNKTKTYAEDTTQLVAAPMTTVQESPSTVNIMPVTSEVVEAEFITVPQSETSYEGCETGGCTTIQGERRLLQSLAPLKTVGSTVRFITTGQRRYEARAMRRSGGPVRSAVRRLFGGFCNR